MAGCKVKQKGEDQGDVKHNIEGKKKKKKQWELTNKGLRYSYRAIWSIYFCSSTALISLPLPPVLRRETFLHFRDKNHSLLIHSSSFVSISHNKEITPTCDKSTHIHQTSLKSASDGKQKDDSLITERAREHRSLSERLNSERLSGAESKCTDSLCIFKIGFKPLTCTTCGSCFTCG